MFYVNMIELDGSSTTMARLLALLKLSHPERITCANAAGLGSGGGNHWKPLETSGDLGIPHVKNPPTIKIHHLNH